MEVLVALSCYTLYIENRKNLEVVRMNNQRPMFINILLVVLLFLVVGSLFSAVVGIVGSLLWLAVKILVPVAIIVWLVRTISGNNGNCRRRYLKKTGFDFRKTCFFLVLLSKSIFNITNTKHHKVESN